MQQELAGGSGSWSDLPRQWGKFSEVPPLKKEPEIQGSSFTGGAEDFNRAFFLIVFHRQETLQQNAHLQSQACANGFKALEWRQEVQTLNSTDPQGPEKQQPHSSSKVLTSLEPVSQVHAVICQARFNSLAWILEFN